MPVTASSTSGHIRRTVMRSNAGRAGSACAGTGSALARLGDGRCVGRLRLGSGRPPAGGASPRASRRGRSAGGSEPGGLPGAARRAPARSRALRGRQVGAATRDPTRRSSRSSRAATPRSSSSAAGSRTRAHISSSCSRGAVAPRISVSPALTRSAARESSAAPKAAACWRIRSSSSAGCSPRMLPAASGTASMMIRSRSRSSRSSAKRRGSWPPSTTRSTIGEHRRPSPAANASTVSSSSAGVGVAEQGGGHGVGHALGAGAGEQLVEDAERVAHRARARPARRAAARRRLDRDALLLADRGQVVLQLAGRHQPERVVVGARPDGADDLLGLGRREDELHVLRRLLDDLEQRVEALARDHVGLVDDVDLVARGRRREERLLAQVAGVVDATVAGARRSR